MAKGERRVWFKTGGEEFFAGFEKAASLSFADSAKQPLIRAADYALSGARRFIELALRDEPIPLNIREIAFLVLGGILMGVLSHVHPSLGSFPKLGNVMASTQWTRKVFATLSNEFGIPANR